MSEKLIERVTDKVVGLATRVVFGGLILFGAFIVVAVILASTGREVSP